MPDSLQCEFFRSFSYPGRSTKQLSVGMWLSVGLSLWSVDFVWLWLVDFVWLWLVDFVWLWLVDFIQLWLVDLLLSVNILLSLMFLYNVVNFVANKQGYSEKFDSFSEKA